MSYDATPPHRPNDHPNYHPMMRQLSHDLRRRCGIGEGAHLLLAISGGADSMALLHAMHLLASRRRWQLQLHIGHIQHHLRPCAEEDAKLVKQTAAALNLPFYQADLDLNAANTSNLEAIARQARYAALAKMAVDTSVDAVLTAHHGDDQLETMLMRLCRGTTPQGLAAMPWRRPLGDLAPEAAPYHRICRPMLGCTHAMAINFLRHCDKPWREDPTNPATTRGQLRTEVLPALQRLYPAANRKALELAGALRPKDISNARLPLDRADLRAMSAETCQAILNIALQHALKTNPSDALLSNCQRCCQDPKPTPANIDLPGGYQLCFSRTRVSVLPPSLT